MNGLAAAAHQVGTFMAAQGWRYCVIGGLAVARWGEPRTTLDVDFTLLTGWGEEHRYVSVLLDRFASRLSDAAAFATQRRILLLRADNGKDIDIALGALPFEERMVERACPTAFAPGIILPCCTAEDLLIMKAFAGRERDWLDVQGIVARQTCLDRDYVLEQLAPLAAAKGAEETLERVRSMLEQAE